MIPVLRCTLLVLPLFLGLTLSFVACADEKADAEWAKSDAKVAAAKDSFDKIKALLLRGNLPSLLANPTREDWQKAGVALDEAFALIGKMDEKNKTVLLFNGTSNKWRGEAAYALENFKGAVSFFDQAEADGYLARNAQSKDKGSILFRQRAEAKTELYDFAGALADYDKAINLLPDGKYFKNRAALHFEMGDWEGAVADWQRAKELGAVSILDENDGAPSSSNFLDRTYGDKDKTKPESKEALPPFDKNLLPLNKEVAANPNNVASFLARGQYRLEKAQKIKNPSDNDKKIKLLQAANKDYTRAVQLDNKSALAYRKRAQVRGLYVHTKDIKLPITQADAQNDFAQAIRLAPKNAETRYETGLFYLNLNNAPTRRAPTVEEKAEREGELRSAIKNFSTAIYLSPEISGDAHYYRAYAERQLPKPDIHALLTDYDAAIAQNLKFIGEALSDSDRNAALAQAHIVRGKIHLSRGQGNLALADFNAAVKLDFWNVEANLERGKLRVLRGEYDEALQDFDGLITTNPRIVEAWLWRGAARDGKGEIEKARADIEQALKMNPAFKERVRGTRYDAQNPTQNALAPTPSTNDSKIVPTGTALERKEAGNALRSKGETDSALGEYNNAILIDANYADAYNNRGSIYLERDQYDLALADFNRALQIDPKHRLVYLNRAALWSELKETEKQRSDLDRAVEYADTPERKATAYVERALLNLGTDPEKTKADMVSFMALKPKDALMLEQAGRIHLDLKQNENARDNFRQALENRPDWAKARFNLAIALAVLNEASATDELEKALLKAKTEDVAGARRIADLLIEFYPDSAPLKALKERLVNFKTP